MNERRLSMSESARFRELLKVHCAELGLSDAECDRCIAELLRIWEVDFDGYQHRDIIWATWRLWLERVDGVEGIRAWLDRAQ